MSLLVVLPSHLMQNFSSIYGQLLEHRLMDEFEDARVRHFRVEVCLGDWEFSNTISSEDVQTGDSRFSADLPSGHPCQFGGHRRSTIAQNPTDCNRNAGPIVDHLRYMVFHFG